MHEIKKANFLQDSSERLGALQAEAVSLDKRYMIKERNYYIYQKNNDDQLLFFAQQSGTYNYSRII